MADPVSKPPDVFEGRFLREVVRSVPWILSGIAVVYALLAGLHTLQDFDLGWQLATGRWVFQHHSIFSTDVFSYTASGQPWIYPTLSGLIFYVCYLAGGYSALCWLGSLTCAGTVALLLRRNNLETAALAILAVPLIANRTQPRAEMFSTILFVAFLTILWGHYLTGKARLYLLPVLMALWVNLHLGFVAGLGLCFAYLLLELLDLPIASRRNEAVSRLRRTWPWLALTALATLANPWGPSIYAALFRQQRAQSLHSVWIAEWGTVHPSWASLQQAFHARDPLSSFWWLVAAVLLSICIAVFRKRWGAAILLAVALYLGLQHTRLQALFCCVAVVVGGSLLADFRRSVATRGKISPSRQSVFFRLQTAAVFVLAAILISLAGLRSWDLISNRYYLGSRQLALFEMGISWWFPQRAVDFMQREKLPANIFNGYNLGGYLDWQLFPTYRVYIDSRALPFGPELFFRAYDLPTRGPDSASWAQEADSRDINTILIPLSRYQGMTVFPQLHAFCRSQSWAPVYLDGVSAIFVRHTAENSSLIDRLRIDCEKVSLEPVDTNDRNLARTQAELFNAWANAGGVLYGLERYSEALNYLDHAQSIFGNSASAHLLRALVLQQLNRVTEAEGEFRSSLNLEPNEDALFDLGLFYMTQRRYEDAAQIFRQSAESSSRPHEMWMMLGQAELQLHGPESALQAFKKADESSPFHEGGEQLGAVFNSMIATGRAKALYQLGDVSQAVSFQEDAVKLAPEDEKLWSGLADLYDAEGRSAEAAKARAHAMHH